MERTPNHPHHEDQNALPEIGQPEPHLPGFLPVRAEGLAGPADAWYEGLGMGAWLPQEYENDRDGKPPRPLHGREREPAPDRRGCGCPAEPGE